MYQLFHWDLLTRVSRSALKAICDASQKDFLVNATRHLPIWAMREDSTDYLFYRGRPRVVKCLRSFNAQPEAPAMRFAGLNTPVRVSGRLGIKLSGRNKVTRSVSEATRSMAVPR